MPKERIQLLPIRRYGRKSSAEVEICPICLTSFIPDDPVRPLPLCSHEFHTQCIDTWL